MNNLQDFLAKTVEIDTILNECGVSRGNGVNTITNLVKQMNSHIEKNDYSYTAYHALFDESNKKYYSKEAISALEECFSIFLKKIPAIKNTLSFDFIAHFNALFSKDTFVDEWNNLTDQEKKDILYIDESIYKIIREKITVKEFDFLVNDDNAIFNGAYPNDILEWINSNSQITFYKLRKASQGGNNEDFFNSQQIKDAENESIAVREQTAINYLIDQKQLNHLAHCWYDRLDLISHPSISLTYTYNFFKKLEDEVNGYNNIQQNIKLPLILKKWSGKFVDESLLLQEQILFHAETQGKTKDEIKTIYANYPNLVLEKNSQRSLNKEELISLINESKNTEFEEFFNHKMTEKLSQEMPYKRINYMFVYFREKFTNEVSRKPKIK